jgi:hypothetical protein
VHRPDVLERWLELQAAVGECDLDACRRKVGVQAADVARELR